MMHHPNQLKLFPLGALRENINNYSRSDVVLITKQNKNTPLSYIKYYKNLSFDNIFFSKTKYSFLDSSTNSKLEIKKIKGPIFVFCGIGDPKSLRNDLFLSGINVDIFKSYKDHQKYNQFVLNEIFNLVSKNNIKSIITTEKDFVKLPLEFSQKLSIIVLKMNFIMNNNFDDFLFKLIKSH